MARPPIGTALLRRGRWVARVTLHREPAVGGRSPRHEQTVERTDGRPVTEAFARAYARRLQARYDAGAWSPTGGATAVERETVGQWVDAWLAEQRYPEAPKDRARVRAWLPRTRLAGLAVAAVTPRDVAAWLAELRGMPTARGTPMAPRTLRNVADPVARALRSAVFEGVLAADPFAVLPTEHRPKSVDADPAARARRRMARHELEDLVSCDEVALDRRVLYALVALTGVRIGEGVALRWCDVVDDAPLRRVTVAEQWHQRLKERRGTKTGGVRTPPEHPQLAEVLRWWRGEGWASWYGREPEAGDLIVPTRSHRQRAEVGACRRQGAVYRELQADLARAGVARHRVHDLRHTFVSLCADAGIAADVATRWTHTPGGGSARALYLTPSWDRQCAEMARITIRFTGPWTDTGDGKGGRGAGDV